MKGVFPLNQTTIQSSRLNEEYLKIEHSSGLTILLYPMEGFSTSFAMFSTKYGSVDNSFKIGDAKEYTNVPEGIAHYLEHKLFESEDGDAFNRFAKTGASANAFTSFDKTSYIFSCSDNFRESIEILLDFVTHPYFTQESVQKEQGIIGQEIGMYDDEPDWKVMFNLLGCLYKNHPVKIDIAGTIPSISNITADLLYECYNTFYNLNNMVLSVAGNFEISDVIEAADKILKKAPDVKIVRNSIEEPMEVVSKYAKQILPVAVPMFQIGFKGINRGEAENFKNMLFDEMIIDLIAGETTSLYHSLYQDGLINNGLGGSTMAGMDYICTIFSGESKNPNEVYKRLCDEIVSIRKNGIDPLLFDRVKKATYGRYIGTFSRQDSITSILTSSFFAAVSPYDLITLVAEVKLEQLEQRLAEAFDVNQSALSIICSKDWDGDAGCALNKERDVD